MKVNFGEDNYFSIKKTSNEDIYILNFKIKNENNNSHMFIDLKVDEETLTKIATAILTVKAKIKKEHMI